MRDVVFITGNQKKADYLAKFLGHPVEHVKVELTEVQSLDIKEVTKHKLHEAYAKVGKPVLVEDVALEFSAWKRLPGTFIKFFLEEMTAQEVCDLLKGEDRSATARCVYGYFDGEKEVYFEGSMRGTIAEKDSGLGGFGWDRIFIPEGYDVTRAELSPEDDEKTYKIIKPLGAVREFLNS